MTGTSAEAVDVYKKILANQYDDSAKTDSSEEEKETRTQEEEKKASKTKRMKRMRRQIALNILTILIR